jgi:hypothetical protein
MSEILDDFQLHSFLYEDNFIGSTFRIRGLKLLGRLYEPYVEARIGAMNRTKRGKSVNDTSDLVYHVILSHAGTY